MTALIRGIAVSGLALGFLLPCASAGTIDALYVFGDSLSDVGNVYSAVGIPPSPPYYDGRFSNGPLAVEYLNNGLGLAPLTASLLGGTDYAYSSGETGPTIFNTSNLQTDILGPMGQLAQYEAFLSATHTTADPNALYTIWIGSNDLADIAATGDPAQFAADVATVAVNIETTISDLAGLGATNFLVLTVPDLGDTPEAISAGPVAQAVLSGLAAGLDSTLLNGAGLIPSLSALASGEGVNLQVLNTYLLLDSIVASPSTYGFTNVTDQCLVGTTVCANPNQYLFWDYEHPTTAANAIVGADLLLLETPEPGTIALIGVGLLGLAMLRRRR
jgi:outer membrane lipase/esterase